MSYEHYSFDQQDEEGYYRDDDVVVRCTVSSIPHISLCYRSTTEERGRRTLDSRAADNVSVDNSHMRTGFDQGYYSNRDLILLAIVACDTGPERRFRTRPRRRR